MRGKNQADAAQRICNKPSPRQKQHGGHKQTLSNLKQLPKQCAACKQGEMTHKKQEITELFLKQSE